ncbi:MAG: hypothetical protein MUE99_08910, partial [Chitinophagaceae bacterium]|nr:hypothetical protein [Chitinophagaceae bacterium]
RHNESLRGSEGFFVWQRCELARISGQTKKTTQAIACEGFCCSSPFRIGAAKRSQSGRPSRKNIQHRR